MIKKPTAVVAWLLSLAAAFDLYAFVFMASSNATGRELFGACELVLILIAIAMWKRYFEALIDYRLRQLQGPEKDIQP